MGLWLRVFGRSAVPPSADAVLACLNAVAPSEVVFDGDAQSWFLAEVRFADATPLHLERFLASEEGIRAELNTWAAYLETCDYSPNHVMLMERMIQTAQLFTLRRPIDQGDELLVDRLCLALCHFLATMTDGVYQVDDQGFFDAAGGLLLQEY